MKATEEEAEMKKQPYLKTNTLLRYDSWRKRESGSWRKPPVAAKALKATAPESAAGVNKETSKAKAAWRKHAALKAEEESRAISKS